MSQWICNIIFTNVFTGDNKEFLYLIFILSYPALQYKKYKKLYVEKEIGVI